MSRLSTTWLLAVLLAATPLVRSLPVIRAASNASVLYDHHGGSDLARRLLTKRPHTTTSPARGGGPARRSGRGRRPRGHRDEPPAPGARAGRGAGAGGAGRHGRDSRNEERLQAARARAATKLMKLKAVKSFMAELEHAERAETAAVRAPPALRQAPSQEPCGSAAVLDEVASTTTRPGLVTTRRFSGRMQTGCIGGCF